MNKHKEIIWIDALRGFMAFLVVLVHTISGAPVSDEMKRVVFHMIIPCVPCFYFISGFLGYESLRTVSRRSYKERVVKQLRCYVVPAFVFLIIAFPTEDTFRQLRMLNFSTNYFLWTLFVANVIVGAVMLLASSFSERIKLLILSLLILACCIFCHYVSAEMCPALNFKVCVWAVIFFTLGYFAARWQKRFFAILSRRAVVFALLATWLVCVYLMEYSGIYILGNFMFRLGIPVVGSLAFVGLFMAFEPAIECSSRARRVSVYFGRRSLASYVLHWILLSLLWTFVPSLPLGEAGYIALGVVIYLASMFVYDALFAWPRLGLTLFGRPR